MNAVKPVFRLPPLPTPADLLRFYRLRALKQMSQNFLLDPRICTNLVKSAGSLRDAHVIEVGPGPGCLTRPILTKGATVSVIEKDMRFIPCLKLLSEAADKRVQVIHGDVLTYPLERLIPEGFARPWKEHPPPVFLIGNLPFAISTILIVKWMQKISERAGAWTAGRVRMTLTFQKEVSTRITLAAGHPERCRLTVLCQGYCNVKESMTIKGGSFVPKPEVDVGVVKFVPRIEPLFRQPFPMVEKVLNCLFNAKKQKIERSLQNLIPPTLWADIIPEIIKMADVYPDVETLVLENENFSTICDAYAKFCKEEPSIYDYEFRLQKREYMRLRREVKGAQEGQDEEVEEGSGVK